MTNKNEKLKEISEQLANADLQSVWAKEFAKLMEMVMGDFVPCNSIDAKIVVGNYDSGDMAGIVIELPEGFEPGIAENCFKENNVHKPIKISQSDGAIINVTVLNVNNITDRADLANPVFCENLAHAIAETLKIYLK